MSATDEDIGGKHAEAMKTAARRFVHAFNDDDWDTVRDVVASGFVFHHPIGGTVTAGPEGMVKTWAGFKALSPDSWHPIPVMIVEGDYLAVLLPTYGTFTGTGQHAPPPTGGRLDYGMVNMVRFDEDGRLAEMWFGMDPLVEMQQMGVAPRGPARELSAVAAANLAAFRAGTRIHDPDYYGPAGVIEWLQEQWSAFSDLAVTEHFTVTQHDIVAVRWSARATSTGEFMALPPTGHGVEFTGVSMYRIEDGRIAEIWDTRNTLGILHQLNPDIGAGGHHH